MPFPYVKKEAKTFEKYGLAWSITQDPIAIEQHMIQRGGRWQKKNGTWAGEGLFYHFKQFESLLWPHKVWHKWSELILECYLKYRSLGILGAASTGKTMCVATDMLADYYCFSDCTTVLCCSTTLEMLEQRIWGEIKRHHNIAKEKCHWIPGHIMDSRKRIVTDSRHENVEGRDFRNGLLCVPAKSGGSYTGLGCFVTGTLIDTPTGRVPIESIQTDDIVLSAVGPSRVRYTATRTAKTIIKVTLQNQSIIHCTEEHPFFTNMGWVHAIDLTPQHMLIPVHESMSILQEGIRCKSRPEILQPELQAASPYEAMSGMQTGFRFRQEDAMLFQALYDEVENERSLFRPENQIQSQYSRNVQKSETFNNVESSRETKTVSKEQSEGWSGSIVNCEKKLGHSEKTWTAGIWEKWKRVWSNISRKSFNGTVSGSSIQCNNTESSRSQKLQKQDRLAALPQTGFCMAGHQTGSGSGWGFTHETNPERTGQKEGVRFDRVGVDRIEILKRGSDDEPYGCPNGYRVHNLEVEGHPSYSVSGVLVHNSMVGVKNKRVRLVADELSLLDRVFVDAISNLDKNPDFKAVGMGNPRETTDALGVLCEPSVHMGGWDGNIDQTGGTKTWETRRPQGICIQLPGSDSPNLDGKLGIPLITQADIDRDIAFYGKDSWQFTMMNEGRMPRGQGSRRVLTRGIAMKNHAMDDPVWRSNNRIKIASLDAAYKGVGGDRCVYCEMEFGDEAEADLGNAIATAIINQSDPVSKRKRLLALTDIAIVPIVGNSKEEAEEQIAEFVKRRCESSRISPENFFFDSGMRTGLVMALARLWSPGVVSIDCGGPASTKPVSAQIPKLCKDYYSKYVTELWYSVRLTVEAGQFRGMTEEVLAEFCQREWKLVGNNKIEVESKVEMKVKTGRSPDLADCCAIGVEGARRKGFVIDNLSNSSAYAKESQKWKMELMAKVKESRREHSLDYAA